jgi:phenylacetate-CoA ligase
MTVLAEQVERQKRWVLKQDDLQTLVDTLVELEFEDPAQKAKRCDQQLKEFLHFTFSQVPYYQQRLAECKTLNTVDEVAEQLHLFPELTKSDLQVHARELEAHALPDGHQVVGASQTSGTTGKPTRILTTQWNGLIFSLNKQREYRWFDMDPLSRLAVIRLPSQMMRVDGKILDMGQMSQARGWPNLGQLFETGDSLGYSVFNDIADQMRWLTEQNPDYLLAYAESLEHLAFGFERKVFEGGLRAILSISETMTPDMRERINRVFPVPLHQNYGLNELGLVASKCPEGGRYHVHSEAFHVEIVKDDGQPCKVGEQGRIVVTGLMSLGMPLLRYNTDDVATMTDQNCPCGRTLPCFGEVAGRYSRIAYLPQGTLGRVGVLREALSSCPDEAIRPLRKYQIQQLEDQSYRLCVLSEGDVSGAFSKHILQCWVAQGAKTPSLQIVRVHELEAGPSGKFQDFISHFMP